MNENRFFNAFASDTLQNIFQNIDSIKTKNGSSIITTIGPGTEIPILYRSRFFQEDEPLFEALGRPDIFLGPPPNKKASGGRMNAFGISVFYGADDKNVAIAEVRPPVGCKVIVSEFKILRPLNLFDMTLLDKIELSGSIFDPRYNALQEKVAFLKNLCDRIIIPVMPDNENIDYLVTQLISDYLSSMESPTLDGIVYPSVQVSNGRNFVLFNKSSRIINLSLPHGKEITAHRSYDEDGEEEYHIFDIDLRGDGDIENETNYPTIGEVLGDIVDQDFKDNRQPSLKISHSDLSVHTIRSVKYDTYDHYISSSL